MTGLRRSHIWPAGRVLLLAAALFGGRLPGSAVAEEAAAGEKKPKVTFAPEIETKFAEFIKKLAAAQRESFGKRMTKEIEEIAKTTALDAAGQEALQAPSKEAATASAESWTAKAEEFLRGAWPPAQIGQILDQVGPQIESMLDANWIRDYARPTDHAAWREALARTLTAGQAAAWEKAQAERRRVVAEEIAGFLKTQEERTRERVDSVLLARTAELKLALDLAPERGEKLDALAKSAIAKSLEAWRKQMEERFLGMDDAARRQTVKQANIYFDIDEKSLPQNQEIWTSGLAGLLSAEEQQRLVTLAEERKARRVRAMGQALLAELDQRIAFTAAQREQLRPITERLIQAEQRLFPTNNQEEHMNFSLPIFFAAGGKATEEELKSILDPIQRQRWKEVCANQSVESEQDDENAPLLKPEPVAVIAGEPEDVEHAISDYFFEKAEKQRKGLIENHVVKAEDAARVADLSAEAFSRLQTAARGAAENALAGWKTSVEQMIRSQLADVTPQNVKQRLARIQQYYFQRSGDPEPTTVWDKAVKAELTETQRVAWQREEEARKDFRDSAIAGVVVAEFARKHPLTPAQWEKFAPLVAKVVTDYSQDISGMFSSSNSTPWYLQYYSMLMPVVGVPEKEIKTVLTKEQWDRWSGSNDFSNSSTYWDNVRQNHEQRVKPAK